MFVNVASRRHSVGLLLKVVGYEIVIGYFLFLFITSVSGALSRAKRSKWSTAYHGYENLVIYASEKFW